MEITHDTDKKLKIGVLIRDIDNLRNYEYRILQSIIDHPNLELSLFIKDGRGKALSLKNRLKRFLNMKMNITAQVR